MIEQASGLTILEISAVFLSITALLAYINQRFIGLPTTIGVMVISLVVSISVHDKNAQSLKGRGLGDK